MLPDPAARPFFAARSRADHPRRRRRIAPPDAEQVGKAGLCRVGLLMSSGVARVRPGGVELVELTVAPGTPFSKLEILSKTRENVSRPVERVALFSGRSGRAGGNPSDQQIFSAGHGFRGAVQVWQVLRRVDGINFYGRKNRETAWINLGRYTATPANASVPLVNGNPEEWQFVARAGEAQLENAEAGNLRRKSRPNCRRSVEYPRHSEHSPPTALIRYP